MASTSAKDSQVMQSHFSFLANHCNHKKIINFIIAFLRYKMLIYVPIIDWCKLIYCSKYWLSCPLFLYNVILFIFFFKLRTILLKQMFPFSNYECLIWVKNDLKITILSILIHFFRDYSKIQCTYNINWRKR